MQRRQARLPQGAVGAEPLVELRQRLRTEAVEAELTFFAYVDHPGLASHRDHDLAVKLFDEGRYGAVITVTPRGGRQAGIDLCDRLRVLRVATSLGGTHSKVSHVAGTTHRQLDAAALAAAGIGAAAVRISVGLEDPEDLIADLVQALDTL